MTKRETFANRWIKAVRDSPDVQGTTLLVALLLAPYATYDTGKEVLPKQSTIAAQMGSSRETVNRAVKRLERAGWIRLEDTKRGNRKVWALVIPEAPAEPDIEVTAVPLSLRDRTGETPPF